MRRNKAAVLLALMVFLSIQLTGCQMLMQLLGGGGAALPANAMAQGANLLGGQEQNQALAYVEGAGANLLPNGGLRKGLQDQKVDPKMLNKGGDEGSAYVKGDAF